MKNLFLISILSLIILSSCTKLTADGITVTETRTLAEFDGITLSGSNRVYINYGNEFKVILKGSGNLLSRYKTDVVNKNLSLNYKNIIVRHDDVEIYVTIPIIKNVSLSGSGIINIDGNFPRVDVCNLDISGSGEIKLNNEITVDKLTIDLSGSAKVFFQKATCKDADITISGSGDTHVKVSNFLKARISGSGDVYYNGNPTIDSRVSGSGKLIKF